jgi:hypothetical protein
VKKTLAHQSARNAAESQADSLDNFRAERGEGRLMAVYLVKVFPARADSGLAITVDGLERAIVQRA